MDIGPITGIRPMLAVRPHPAAPDLSRVFEVEYLGESPEDQYEGSRQRASRGLEDEEDGEGEGRQDASDQGDAEPAEIPGKTGISFFA